MDLSQACKACIQKQAIRPNKKRRKGGLCNTCYAEQNPHVQQADQNEQRACWAEQKRELRERQMIQSIINNATDESFQKKNVKVFLGDVEKKEGKYIYGVFSGEQEKGAFVEVIMLTPVHEMKIKRGKHETKIVGIVASKDGDEKNPIIIEENRIKCNKSVWTGTSNASCMAVRLTGSIDFGLKGELVRIKNANGELTWLSKNYVRDVEKTHKRERSAPIRLMSTVSLVTGQEDSNENQRDQSSNVKWSLGDKELTELNMLYASLRLSDRMSAEEKDAKRLILSGKLGSHEGAFDILLNKLKCDRLVSRRTDQLIDAYKSLIPYLTDDHRPLTGDEIKRLLNDHNIHSYIDTKDAFTINALRSEWNPTVKLLLEQSIIAIQNANGATGGVAAQDAAIKQAEAQAAAARNIVKSTVTMLMRSKPPKLNMSSVEKTMKSCWDLSLIFDKVRGRQRGPVPCLLRITLDNSVTPFDIIERAGKSFRPEDKKSCKGSKGQKPKSQIQPPRKCSVQSCESHVHTTCRQMKYCWKHAAEADKPKCKMCKKRIRQYRGGLCYKCSGGKVKTCQICRHFKTDAYGSKCSNCKDRKLPYGKRG